MTHLYINKKKEVQTYTMNAWDQAVTLINNKDTSNGFYQYPEASLIYALHELSHPAIRLWMILAGQANGFTGAMKLYCERAKIGVNVYDKYRKELIQKGFLKSDPYKSMTVLYPVFCSPNENNSLSENELSNDFDSLSENNSPVENDDSLAENDGSPPENNHSLVEVHNREQITNNLTEIYAADAAIGADAPQLTNGKIYETFSTIIGMYKYILHFDPETDIESRTKLCNAIKSVLTENNILPNSYLDFVAYWLKHDKFMFGNGKCRETLKKDFELMIKHFVDESNNVDPWDLPEFTSKAESVSASA